MSVSIQAGLGSGEELEALEFLPSPISYSFGAASIPVSRVIGFQSSEEDREKWRNELPNERTDQSRVEMDLTAKLTRHSDRPRRHGSRRSSAGAADI